MVKIKELYLKCDNCVWIDKSILIEEFQNYIDHPCPECGHNLLTNESFDNLIIALNMIQNNNEYPFESQDQKIVRAEINSNDLSIKIIDNE